MKTPTLIVRLIGFYLVVKCGLSLVALATLQSSTPAVAGGPSAFMSQINLACWAGLVFGAYAVVRAGSLARLLTLDAEPGSGKTDLTDSLLSAPIDPGADLGDPGDGASGEATPRR